MNDANVDIVKKKGLLTSKDKGLDIKEIENEKGNNKMKAKEEKENNVIPLTDIAKAREPIKSRRMSVNEINVNDGGKGKELKESLTIAVDMSISTPETKRNKIKTMPDLHKLLLSLKDNVNTSSNQIMFFQSDEKVASFTSKLSASLRRATKLLQEICSTTNVFTSINRQFRERVFEVYLEIQEYSNSLFLSVAEATAKATAISAAVAQRKVVNFLADQNANNSNIGDESMLHKAEALCINADRHYFGHGVVKALETAFSFYKEAAIIGYVKGMVNLGSMYLKGEGCERDREKGYTWLRAAAELEDMEACVKLSAELIEEIKITNDGAISKERKKKYLAEAFSYLEKAIANNDSEAMVLMGNLYENGSTGEVPNMKMAATLYGRAAANGNSKGQNKYGYMFYTGRGVNCDFKEAFRLFKESAKQGNANAFNNLGICYEVGRGVAADTNLAYTCYQRASDLGHTSGLNNLAYMLLREVVSLGTSSQEGRAKCQKAVKLLHQASNEMCFDSFYHLGTIYENGLLDGCIDLPLARSYYKQAADSPKGHSKAAYRCAVLLDKIEPLSHSFFIYLKKAVDKGHTEATVTMGKLILKKQAEGDLQNAIKLFKRAAQQGSGEALYCLGNIYANGEHIDDLAMAREAFQESLEKGFVKSKIELEKLKKRINQ